MTVRLGSPPAGPSPLDRGDARAVGVEVLRRQAVGDATMCALASPELLPTLRREGRCTVGAPGEPAPAITVLFSKVCGDRAGVEAQIEPAGRDGKPFAFVGLSQGADGLWSVRGVTMFTDRDGLGPYECASGPRN
ncbi:hypothetical protein [Kutzneria sp. 744]|uniref:hypothetical protein n=1 Tax=Kutzneria sp. (strain 744) TaxID=345341 RepID=UPI0012F88179|nr:hypothetical protein [Kutzneria sp. 744]